MRRLARWSLGIGVVLVLLLVAGIGAVTWTVRRSFPDYTADAPLPGLTGTVDVVRDNQGVPRIYADTAEDLFRAQGYVHAQDRFWEMDFRRHVTAGRLAELFGEDQVETDTFIRTMGWRRVAERELPLLAPATRRYLRAYAEGVNAYLRTHTGPDLSLEHAVLGLTNRGYVPEPWEPADSLAWLKAMAWDLRANMVDEIERSLMAATLPVERVEQLYPDYPYDRNGTIVESATPPSGAAEPAAPAAAVAPAALREVVRRATRVDAVIGPTGAGIGSNAWAVSGDHTSTGEPLLANDPHLAPALPSIWTQVGLHCRVRSSSCPFDVAGFSFSGLPGVVIGHNDRVAWGFTNLGADVSDLVLERVDGDRYLTEDGYVPLDQRTEVVEVAGGEPVRLTVRTTRHGPLISDASAEQRQVGRDAPVLPGEDAGAPRGDGYDVALRWTALQPNRTADAIFAIDAARDWSAFRAAAADFAVPSQNLVYADTDGNIGYQAPGVIPVRSAGDGRWPVPGWTGRYEWVDTVPYEALPSELNPADGLVVTANQQVVPPEYPFLLASDTSYGYRAERIRERLQAVLDNGGTLTADDMLDVAMDGDHPAVDALLPVLLAVGGLSGYEADGQEVLENWDGQQGQDSAGAAYFNAVYARLLSLTFDDDIPDEEARASGGDRWVVVLEDLLDTPDDPFWDDVATIVREDRDSVLRQAMLLARDDVTRLTGKEPDRWTWGRMHTLELRSATFGESGIPPLEALFNRGPYAVSGGTDAPNATGWDAQQGFEVTAVPSMRMVVDLGDLDASQWVNLTGQSGHPFHDHYVDQVDAWRNGELFAMRWDDRAIRDDAASTMTLRPSGRL